MINKNVKECCSWYENAKEKIHEIPLVHELTSFFDNASICSACFYEPLFVPLFGDKIQIEPVQTVLVGADECVFRIKL